MAAGKKSKRDEDRRSVHMLIGLTPGERKMLDEHCGEMYPGVYLREMAFEAIRRLESIENIMGANRPQ